MVEFLFEDNHLLAANKPAGLLTQDSGTDQESLEGMLRAWIKERDHKPGNVFLHALHRLDKGASGIVLFAKSQKSLSRMTKAFRDKTTKKNYWALVEGKVSDQEGSLEHYLTHGDFHAAVVDSKHPQGKHSILHYKTVTSSEKFSLIEVELITGRYHQIRAQWADHGHPLLGDEKYGSKLPFEGIALHHRMLTFVHPTTQEKMEIVAPLPRSWSALFGVR